ncbi:exodeoxyribonuclease V subunit alpha [Nocardioides lianchengensis]|uniref:RecBCD enzyme subunit RecD n=1 Tax=Nocardioides lianchengensis TaxID=1045774 RepID=A0A1G6ZUL2_9ACTN|nr:exodeoxyribonuclease V subunit alpha [Nocardioides lianchengensis]NYG12224.1 exodeoxyribonuclease V alpha subunit [Nocardioides lianchengensis]SDE06043.1 DNA helicase/exodeoxyribonuclease V, alpha subunit [Nocardioides lianchengensis]
MTETFEPVGEHDWRLAASATGLLAEFNAAGLLSAADVHVATRVAALGEEEDERVRLAVALAVRAVRRGSVGLDLAAVPAIAPELAWPEAEAWAAAVAASPLVAAGAVRWELGLLYLDRYHRLETQVHADLEARLAQAAPGIDEARLDAALARVRGGRFSPEQEAAVAAAVRRRTTILTGGPGTGKTTTVARLLALLADQATGSTQRREGRLSIALAAPTGKAATRLQEAVAAEVAEVGETWPEVAALVGRLQGQTLHRLLGWRPDNATRFRHDRGNRLKYDVVVVDESSMVELTMMGRLLEALRPESVLVLLGDPQQLTSVGAGAVLGDLVAGYDGRPDSPVAALTRNFRSTDDILALSVALRAGDADTVVEVLRTPSDEVSWVDTSEEAEVEAALRPDSLRAARAVWAAAVAEQPALAIEELDRYRLLCAHREGPYGVRRWNQRVERWLAEEVDVDVHGPSYVGRPLLVTSNDYALDVYNGETGVVVQQGDRRRAFVAGSGRLKEFAPGRLDAVETMHAMTIHKSQGSQVERVTVLLPEADSRLLTRELFYTAVTRAQQHVRVVGSEAAVRAAVATRALRATGLQQRLRETGSAP